LTIEDTGKAEAAYAFVSQAGHGPAQIIVHGASRETAVAVDPASQWPRRGVVPEAPFPSTKDVAGSVLPPNGLLLIWSYDSRSKMRPMRAPTLFNPSGSRCSNSARLSQALFAAAPEPKTFGVVLGQVTTPLLNARGGA
jgi:hypothetical protein